MAAQTDYSIVEQTWTRWFASDFLKPIPESDPNAQLFVYSGGRRGSYQEAAENGVEQFFGVILPDPGHPQSLYFILVAREHIENAPANIHIGFTNGAMWHGQWDGTGELNQGCFVNVKNPRADQYVAFINHIFGADLPQYPLPTEYTTPVVTGPPQTEDPTFPPPPHQRPSPGADPNTPGGTIPDPTQSTPSIDPDAPGNFAAGMSGLPSEPGYFKTPAGYCRKWQPWERAILKMAQDKNKKEMEAMLEKAQCFPPQKKCVYTTRY